MKTARTYRGKPVFLVYETVRDLLRNPVYRSGRYVPGFAWAPELSVPVPVLVDAETWALAQGSRAKPELRDERRVQYPYLLRGVVRCAACGRTMRAHTIGARHPYYRCASVDRPSPNAEPCPTRGNVRADKVDEAVWRFLHDLLSRPGALRRRGRPRRDPRGPAGWPGANRWATERARPLECGISR